MISYIKLFRLQYHLYQPEYLITLWQSDSPYELYDFDGKRFLGRMMSATLNQELNTGGTFTMSVKKDKYVTQYVLGTYGNYIEVQTPYSLDGGVQPSVVSSNPELLSKWRGIRSKTVEYPDHYEVTYEGELSYLSMVTIDPYETTAGNTYDFFYYMVGLYNSGIDENTYLRFLVNSNNVDTGDTVVRSNSSISTPWNEINEKVLKKYNNQICVYTSTNTGQNTGRRICRLRGLPTEPSGNITGNDVISVSHTVDDTQRAKYWKVYGAKTDPDTEGDLTRISGSYYNTNNTRSISHEHRVYDEIVTTATLTTRAQELYNRAMLDSDGVTLVVTPERASTLLLGDLYNIQCSRASVSGVYRLTKRTINVLNPAKNKYTFGTAQRFITR